MIQKWQGNMEYLNNMKKNKDRTANSIKKLRSNSLSISLVSFNKFQDDSTIDLKMLVDTGFLKKKDHKKSIKVIDSIQFKKKLQFKDFKFTPGAKKRIEDNKLKTKIRDLAQDGEEDFYENKAPQKFLQDLKHNLDIV